MPASFADDLDVIDQGPVDGDLLELANGFANALGGGVVNNMPRAIQPMLWTGTAMRSASGRRRQMGALKLSLKMSGDNVDIASSR